jgi:predicted outer membrane repeat protein
MVISDSFVSMWNITFSANSASAGGGALVVGGSVSVDDSTFYGHSGVFGGSAIDRGGGMVYVENSILAGYAGNNCFGGITSLGHNIEDGGDCMLNATGDMTTTNPLLGPLADNGGPTKTHALLPGSPAIKHGKISDCQPADQRGYLRVGGCDIGAFQVVYRVLDPLLRK